MLMFGSANSSLGHILLRSHKSMQYLFFFFLGTILAKSNAR